MTKLIKFVKMHGAGNDYIYVYTPDFPIAFPAEVSKEWSRFHFGIGSDGLILIGRSDKADFSMRIFNNDGSEAMMCGNGIRCVGKFVYDHHLTTKTEITVDTLSGIKILKLHIGNNNKVKAATVDMGTPIFINKEQLATPSGSMTEGVAEVEGVDYIGTFVCMGNPHFVIFTDDVASIPLESIGPKLEHHLLFPKRCNIEFAQILPDGCIRMRVWERGSGITLACGTGACATAVAACLTGRAGRCSDVIMDGGRLTIEWKETDGHILMTGSATKVFEGEIEMEE